jgi:nucleoside-diphosphate-sugar epimerase
MAKYFLTGGTGFIGCELALKLAEEGHKVNILVRNPEKNPRLKHPNFDFFKGDLEDQKVIEKAMENCDGVFHLAAFASVWSKNPRTYFDINVGATQNILHTAKEMGLKKAVITSTAGTLGPAILGPVHEDTSRLIDFFTEYESSKFISEERIKAFAAKESMEAVIVNPTRVYGPGYLSESNAVTKMIIQYAKGKWRAIPGSGESSGNYVFVEDVVRGHILAMEKGRNGERYILGGENVSYNELFDIISDVSGKNYKLFKIPIGIMMFFANLQVAKNKVTGSPPLITPKWIRRYLYNWSNSSEKAKTELGYQITPLAQGIKKTLDWNFE